MVRTFDSTMYQFAQMNFIAPHGQKLLALLKAAAETAPSLVPRPATCFHALTYV
ncbi:MAG TPA: hypothetical protein VGI60_02365 [Chthoniobacterales bacterium]|jgi:hypothetical protein